MCEDRGRPPRAERPDRRSRERRSAGTVPLDVLVTVGGRRHDLPQLLDAQRRDQLADLCLRAACGATRHDAGSLRYLIAGQASERRGGQFHRRRHELHRRRSRAGTAGSNVGEPLISLPGCTPGLDLVVLAPSAASSVLGRHRGESDLCPIADARRARPGCKRSSPQGGRDGPRGVGLRVWPPPSRIGRPDRIGHRVRRRDQRALR